MAPKRIRYAVVGLGHIAQVAVLPAFAHASANSELVALVSSDETKLRLLGRRHDVSRLYTYDRYEELLASGDIDAVYIALPNHQHREFTVRAAKHGVHILCEKPLALTERECLAMIRAADANDVKLMTAYRLHFERANLEAVETVRGGKIGEPRLFNSLFCMDVKEGDIRLRSETGAVLRFPGDRLATFICNFGTSFVARFQIVGTKGNLALDPAFEYAMELERHLTIGERESVKTYAQRDQFAPELLYFSECIQKNREPEPSGWEGLADVRIVTALYRSARSGKAVSLEPLQKTTRPTLKQEIHRPAVRKPKLIKTASPSK